MLTSLPRDEWAAQRGLLLADPTNASSLRLVESALFCVAFESGALTLALTPVLPLPLTFTLTLPLSLTLPLPLPLPLTRRARH